MTEEYDVEVIAEKKPGLFGRTSRPSAPYVLMVEAKDARKAADEVRTCEWNEKKFTGMTVVARLRENRPAENASCEQAP